MTENKPLNEEKGIVPNVNSDERKPNIQPKSKAQKKGISQPKITMQTIRELVNLRFGSISEFGKHMGLARSHAHAIVWGNFIPKRRSTYERIANNLGIPVDVLKEAMNAGSQ